MYLDQQFESHRIGLIGGLILIVLTLAAGIAVYALMQRQAESVLVKSLAAALQNDRRLFESEISSGVTNALAVSTRPFVIHNLQLLQAKVVFFEHSAGIRDAVARLLLSKQRYKEAADLFRQATILTPEEPSFREGLGLAQYYAKQYKEAANTLRLINLALEQLNNGRPARAADISKEDEKAWHMLQLLTSLPALYVSNVDEASAESGNELSKIVAERAARDKAKAVVISAQIESEIALLDPEERNEFLETLGLSEPGLNRLIREAYKMWLAPGARIQGADGVRPANTPEGVDAELAKRAPQIAFKGLGGGASKAGDLVWTYGKAEWQRAGEPGVGYYVRIWQHQDAGYRLVFDQLLVAPPPKKA